MAKLEDYVDESGNPKKPEPKPEKVEAEAKDEQAAQPEPDDGIPEKYKGKSIQEVVQMHQEVERLAGRNGQELGQTQKRLEELQSTVDTLILQGQKPEEETVDYYSDPETAITKAIENNPILKGLAEKVQKTEELSKVQQLYAKHPDASDVVKSEAFQNWMQDESGRRILYEAAQAGNPAAAESILNDFKKSTKPKQDNRKSETKRASTGVTTSSVAPTSREILKRRDVIELMKKDPRKYQDMAKEIRQAYAEGRVI